MNTQFGCTIDLFGEVTRTFLVDVEFTCQTDSSYGADADGNRGVSVAWAEDVVVTIYDESRQDVTEMVKREFPAQYVVIEATADDAADGVAQGD